ncbi:MAG: DUF2147 domain-containing protein [Psychroserpens sp.]|nr:DUF2147 domain-containing protein [Psychroserpens sp.]
MRRILIVVFGLLISITSQSQSIFGKWKTIDDETGQAKSIVEIYEKDGRIYGKITEIFDDSKRDLPCKFCKGDDYNKPLIGLEIIKNMEPVEQNLYKNGTITNPEDGKVYTCRLKLDSDPDTLQVRGYVAFFYKTQYWKRLSE